MSNAQVPANIEERGVKFVPFGASDELELSIGCVQQFVATESKNGNKPTKRDCIQFLMLCKASHLNPFAKDCYLIGYDNRDGSTTFSLIVAHQAFLKRAETHADFDGMQSGVLVFKKGKPNELIEREGDFLFDDDILAGGWATVHFKTRTYPIVRRVNLKTFRKPYGRWNDDPAGMIVKCAEADALRSAFPTMLGGCYTEEEMPVPADHDNQPPENTRRRVQRAKPITVVQTKPVTNPVSSVPGQPEAAPAVEVTASTTGAVEQHLDESPNHRSSPPTENRNDGPAGLYPAGSGNAPHASEGSDHQGDEQDQEDYPTVDELATLAETLKCPEDQCMNWAESALNLLAEGCIDDAYKYIGEMPWTLKPKKGGKSGSKIKPAEEIPEDEIPF